MWFSVSFFYGSFNYISSSDCVTSDGMSVNE
jgi:hypothetical protein